ncbi:TPA: CRISPR-associated endonuclease Cas2, partial [Campylobacter jejuni]|nr:CRISPR-associated endonuclease Cas2 [Campylobacter coli]HEF6981424.1 CRISPR-associated endonuclease Cas2 [Campylobacter jejuni]EAL0746026.1 CRISPR-associated endonuclease Cas2 [Campylobacter coli]EJI3889566.1 CRISPR-associated endonuclease Cas2 [Campylobacter coli]HEG8189790.1 CRISPR-associated endonuclease Cas2 [Campylobacter jejuni]
MIEDKFMRVLLMFDVPTKSKKEQKLASKFRNNLIKLGYFMLQFSVYMRICKGLSSAKSSIENVKKILPPYGNVRALIITEKQFDKMELLLGGIVFNEKVNNETNLTLFDIDSHGEF